MPNGFILVDMVLLKCAIYSFLKGEGISYRGRILMSIECFEGEPDETGTATVEDTPPLAKVEFIIFSSNFKFSENKFVLMYFDRSFFLIISAEKKLFSTVVLFIILLLFCNKYKYECVFFCRIER